jgi:hypothetical protein
MILEAHSCNSDYLRICRRILRRCAELFVFLDEPQVPADDHLAQGDIPSSAATHNDGDTSRCAWGADAFANLKSMIRTCPEAGRSFLAYGLEVMRATLAGAPPPLPLDNSRA